MQAIILASGLGGRLLPLTQNTPKCLIKIGGTTLLKKIFDSLVHNQVKNVIITTGFAQEKIKKFVAAGYPNLDVTYVYNPQYASTNAIYSLWLARKVLKNDDVILLHSDLLYDDVLMTKISQQTKSCALVQKEGKAPAKDFKAKIENGVITQISVKVNQESACFCAPLYKFTKDDFVHLIAEVDKFVQRGKVDCYAEEAFNQMTPKFKLYPLYYKQKLCMEIDDWQDLEKAKSALKNQIYLKKSQNRI